MIYKDIDTIMLMIKHKMLDKGIKQKDIVRSTGYKTATISNLLNGRSKNVTLDTVVMLCHAIGCDLDINLIDIEDSDE